LAPIGDRLLSRLRGRARTLDAALLALLLVCGAVYVGNAWSPSSYGYAFHLLGVEGHGPVAGEARAIRADEWAGLTPLTQATVNNGFARYNRTSLYGGDLRMMFSLPVFDWGMAFKPTFWLYPLANPARAFSFHHFAVIALFLVGYTLLFRMAGAGDADSALLAVILFFTGFTQYWWTILGPPLALFPWLLVVADLPLGWIWKAPLFYWVATAWLLSYFYPPLIIPLAFVALLFLVAFRPGLLGPKNLARLGVATLAAVATAGLYLKDYLARTWNTHYPGQRMSGGGGVGLDWFAAQFLPTSQVVDHRSLIEGVDVCLSGVVGTYYLLFVLCFLDWGAARRGMGGPGALRAPIALGAGLLLTWAWMFLPLPEWVGVPLLWNRVPPERMLYAAGLLLLLLAWLAAARLGLRPTWPRAAVFAGLVALGWLAFKVPRAADVPLRDAPMDLIVILPLLALVWLARRLTRPGFHTGALVVFGAMAAAAFATFNPLQPAWPIFNRADLRVNPALVQSIHRTGGVAVMEGFHGAVFNGLGYPSASHVLAVPEMDFWRRRFPGLPEADLERTFNRFLWVKVGHVDRPTLTGIDAVLVPGRVFLPAPGGPP
jgi:hypothetical protein